MKTADEVLLAIDPGNFQKCEGVTLSPLEPVKHGSNPVIKPGKIGSPDSFRVHFGGSVVKQGGIFKMYYIAFDDLNGRYGHGGRPAAAESRDGLVWRKPAFRGKFYNGGYKNNLLAGFSNRACCVSVVYDWVRKRYFAVESKPRVLSRKHFEGQEVQKKWHDFGRIPAIGNIYASVNGLTWRPVKRRPVFEKLETARLFNVDGGFVISGQQIYPWVGPEYEGAGRVVSFFESEDLEKWRKSRAVFSYGNAQTHVGISNLGRFGKTYIGLAGEFSDSAELPDQHFEIRLVCSRDCLVWKAPFESSFIRRGACGEWDWGGVQQGDGCIEKNGNYLIYYTGTSIGNTPFSRAAVGAVSLPKDRFGYYSNSVGWEGWNFTSKIRSRRRGLIITRFIENNPGGRLYLNISNTSPESYFKVCLSDMDNREIPGYTLKEAPPVFGDGLSRPARWKNGRCRLPATGFQACIHFFGGRFREECPRLYAVYVA